MSLYNIVKNQIIECKQNKENGKFNGIPFPFKRLSEFIPVIDKGMSIGLISTTGGGKSKLSRFLGLYHPYSFAKKNDYKIKIIIFALEDDILKVYKNIICHYLSENFNIKISLQELESKGDRILPDFAVDALNQAEDFFKDFEKDVTLINGVSEPKDMYDVLEKHALKTGKIIPYEIEIDGEIRVQQRYESEYHTIVIIDNFANIDEGKEHSNEREAISELARKYIREKCCNFFNYSVIQVLQNDYQSDIPTYTTTGKTIISKLEPSLNSVALAKGVSRNMHLVMGLFNPSKYDLIRYPLVGEKDSEKAYDIEILGNRFRSIRILKANDSDVGMRSGLIFDAFNEHWEELPKPESDDMKKIYTKLKGNKTKFTSSKNMIIYKEEYQAETGDDDLPF